MEHIIYFAIAYIALGLCWASATTTATFFDTVIAVVFWGFVIPTKLIIGTMKKIDKYDS